MKIAYLMHSDREYDELVESINQLIKQGDHVFIMINDNDLRGKVHFVYAEDRRVHISETQEFAQEGDLSLARGTIIQMKEAIAFEELEYFINITDGMIPIKTRTEIISVLESNKGKDFYYIDRSEKDDETLRKKTLKFYTFTNMLSFPTSKFIRSFTKGNASFLNMFGLRRKLEDPIYIGSPWFMLSRESAIVLANQFDYVSASFKLSWYPEELFVPMMIHKFIPNHDNHINNDYRAIGPDGSWIESQGAKIISQEVLNNQKDALFAAKITCEPETLHLYNDYFDKYNEDFIANNLSYKKEEKMINPEIFMTRNKD